MEEAEKLAADLVSSALARAQEHCAESGLPPVEVFAVVVMSNHLHLVVRAPGKNLAAFMGYFLARVAQTLNLLLGRVGPVFPRRYDAQPILDEEAAAGRIKYVLENPKKAGLVRCFTEWPGFVAVAGLHEGEELETKHFDRTGWQLAKRPKERAGYWRKSRLKLSRLPGMESLSCAAYLATVKSWCDSRPAERCLGVEGVLDADVNQRPKMPKRSRRPYAFGRPESVDAYREVSRLRYAAYDAVRALAKVGERVEWPEGDVRAGRCRCGVTIERPRSEAIAVDQSNVRRDGSGGARTVEIAETRGVRRGRDAFARDCQHDFGTESPHVRIPHALLDEGEPRDLTRLLAVRRRRAATANVRDALVYDRHGAATPHDGATRGAGLNAIDREPVLGARNVETDRSSATCGVDGT